MVAHRHRVISHTVHRHVDGLAFQHIGNGRSLIDVSAVKQEEAVFAVLVAPTAYIVHLVRYICHTVVDCIIDLVDDITVQVRGLNDRQPELPVVGLRLVGRLFLVAGRYDGGDQHQRNPDLYHSQSHQSSSGSSDSLSPKESTIFLTVNLFISTSCDVAVNFSSSGPYDSSKDVGVTRKEFELVSS